MKSELKEIDLRLSRKETAAATLAGLLDYHGPGPSEFRIQQA